VKLLIKWDSEGVSYDERRVQLDQATLDEAVPKMGRRIILRVRITPGRGVAWRPPAVSHTAISISVTVPRAVSAIPAGEQRYIR
jgi:hypothetical protein